VENPGLVDPTSKPISLSDPGTAPLGPTGSGNSPTGSSRWVPVYRNGTPLAIPGESVQGNCPRGYSLERLGVCHQAGTGSSATGNRNRDGHRTIVWWYRRGCDN